MREIESSLSDINQDKFIKRKRDRKQHGKENYKKRNTC